MATRTGFWVGKGNAMAHDGTAQMHAIAAQTHHGNRYAVDLELRQGVS